MRVRQCEEQVIGSLGKGHFWEGKVEQRDRTDGREIEKLGDIREWWPPGQKGVRDQDRLALNRAERGMTLAFS